VVRFTLHGSRASGGMGAQRDREHNQFLIPTIQQFKQQSAIQLSFSNQPSAITSNQIKKVKTAKRVLVVPVDSLCFFKPGCKEMQGHKEIT
jgi:hypothetical protein